ncbi:MAG: helix-turn-helix transcriptional regulator [Synechococcales cyanobacterium RU_4_20]|nr:helix-turn-helix transcriptional regulator [Synechococcales cyanobacterium RU_4_20]
MPRILSNKEVGEILRTARSHRDMTQDEVALALRISRSSYARLESGQRNLTRSEIQDVATFYHLPVSHLLNARENQI